MNRVHVCDYSDCPANAAHDVTIYGQDFYFCNHHWVELADALPNDLDPWRPGPEPEVADRGREPAPTGSGHRP